VLTRDHTALPAAHTFIDKWNEPYLSLRQLTQPQPQSVAPLWLVLIWRPAEGRSLSWRGWLGEIGLLRWFAARRRSPTEADLGRFSMFGRRRAPTRGAHKRTWAENNHVITKYSVNVG